MREALPVIRAVRLNRRDGPMWPPALCEMLCRVQPPGRAVHLILEGAAGEIHRAARLCG